MLVRPLPTTILYIDTYGLYVYHAFSHSMRIMWGVDPVFSSLLGGLSAGRPLWAGTSLPEHSREPTLSGIWINTLNPATSLLPRSPRRNVGGIFLNDYILQNKINICTHTPISLDIDPIRKK